MSADPQTAADDLAFIRALVTAGDDGQKQFGQTYLAAGLCYGAQMAMHGLQALGLLPSSGLAALAIGLGPTLVFIPALLWVILRNRRPAPPGIVGRAVASVFGAVGFANLALIAVIGSVAWREQSLTIWLLYPCAVFVLQGAAWFVSFMLRRRTWLGFVAAGWVLSALGMAVFIEWMPGFILCTSFGIFACMALPGWVMIRLSRKAAA